MLKQRHTTIYTFYKTYLLIYLFGCFLKQLFGTLSTRQQGKQSVLQCETNTFLPLSRPGFPTGAVYQQDQCQHRRKANGADFGESILELLCPLKSSRTVVLNLLNAWTLML